MTNVTPALLAITEQHLDTDPTYFARVWSREKLFEVRRNRRCFQKGDRVVLHEKSFDGDGAPAEPDYHTGRQIVAEISYVLRGGVFGLDPDYCVLQLAGLQNFDRAGHLVEVPSRG